MKRQEKKLHKADNYFFVASKAWDSGDFAQAFLLYKKGAEMGESGSQLNLGYFYDCGLHVKKDKKEAMRWYRKAYRRECAAAAKNIAILYKEEGSFGKMLWWFRKAVRCGNYDALLELGKCYEKGLGCKRNLKKARLFYRQLLQETNVTEASREIARRKV